MGHTIYHGSYVTAMEFLEGKYRLSAQKKPIPGPDPKPEPEPEPEPEQYVDIMGKRYSTVKFQLDSNRSKYAYRPAAELAGKTAIWMASNLDYLDGTDKSIRAIEGRGDDFGCLYTWDLAMELAPSGWHLPTRADWCALLTSLDTPQPTGSLRDTEGLSFMCDAQAKRLMARDLWRLKSEDESSTDIEWDKFGFRLAQAGTWNIGGELEYSFISTGNVCATRYWLEEYNADRAYQLNWQYDDSIINVGTDGYHKPKTSRRNSVRYVRYLD